MVSLLNGGLSDENPKKRALENGYHSSSFGNLPNYKPRKVSAVRQFPPGCGPNAQQIIPQAQRNVTVAVGEHLAPTLGANCVISECEGDTQSCDVMSVRVDSNANMVIEGNGKLDVATQLCAETETDEFKMPADKEKQQILDASIDYGTPVVAKADGRETSAEPEIQSHDSPGSPVEQKEDISLDDLGGEVLAVVREGMHNQINEEVLDATPMDVELPKGLEQKSFELSKEWNGGEEAQDLVMQLDNVEPLSLVKHDALLSYVPSKNEAVRSPKENFRRRRVSATRDFPPYCGINAPSVPKEECLRITSGDKDLIGIKKGFLENEELKPSKVTSGLETSPDNTGEDCLIREAVVAGGEETKRNIEVSGFERRGGKLSTPNRISNATQVKVFEECKGSMGKEIVLYEPVGERTPSNDVSTSGHNQEAVVVNALMVAPFCPWSQEKVSSNSDAVKDVGKAKKEKAPWAKKNKAVAKKTIRKADPLGKPCLKMDSVCVHKDADETAGLLDMKDEGEFGEYEGPSPDLPSGCTRDVEVTLPPYGPSSSTGDARNKVRETLRLFQTICRKLLQGEEAKMKPEFKRIDLEAVKIMKNKKKEVGGKKYLGAVPGVEVGDEFQYRVELAMVGVHRLYQAGIDYMKHNGMHVAISVVASGAYSDDMEDADSLIYSGQGGNTPGKDKKREDQKLERGNLALRNSITTKNPVRVIHGMKETKSTDSSDSKSKIVTTYVYDGLYTVEHYWPEKGKHGNQVFMFKLKRIPGQPELAWKEVKMSKKSKVRLGVCVDDIAGGKESVPICAVNTINNEKPPPFSYITKMMYTDWSHMPPPHGCECTGRCSDSGKCACARRNGGEIPYNRNGAIVEAKPLVYECGPSCKCPPSCYNRVSQHGIKLPLEIFKTETRGWGVRSLTSISSGTFICEYVGELLEDKEAEQRTNDEYLFDIGHNYSDFFVDPDELRSSADQPAEEVGYTIDAAYYGNVGRFINHSCSPNLYAQNILYDHDEKRMPHIMLFAAENIPALKELTYHYNYSLDQVRDSNGNIKMKSCYCGSSECTGRLY
ncbi:hypothetical protein M9H77_32973 [Catharanthus roseus]|uniref:Uncharacterized protein n=1 Tax=Catharanthus roseus TaxID=4058 RepID=A0ACC0A8F2_CATRO|nr:hypothetical protein M9H77_32973 [Catharanthus roseus]